MQKTYDKESTEELILKAAKTVFIEKGYSGARMQAIADKAKINKAMLHYYFRSKEQLFDRILEDIVLKISNVLIVSLGGKDSVMKRVERLVNNYSDTILENPYIPLFVLNELAQNRLGFQQRMLKNFKDSETFTSFLNQLKIEQEKKILKPVAPHHFVLTLISLILFPFIAKPIFTKVMGIPDDTYSEMINERRTIITEIMRQSFMVNK